MQELLKIIKLMMIMQHLLEKILIYNIVEELKVMNFMDMELKNLENMNIKGNLKMGKKQREY